MKDRTIVFYITADQEVIDMAEIIQSYLQKVGLKVQIKQLEWSALNPLSTTERLICSG